MVMVYILVKSVLVIISGYSLGELNLRHCGTNIPELYVYASYAKLCDFTDQVGEFITLCMPAHRVKRLDVFVYNYAIKKTCFVSSQP